MTDPKMPPNVRVKPLVWEWVCEYGCVARAKTNIGTYSLHVDEDSASSRMLLYLHLTEDGDCTKYAIEVAAEYLDDDDMMSRAQADYQSRILSALEVVEDEVGRYVPRHVPSGMPTDCCEFGVIDMNKSGIEVCRCWTAEDATLISAALTKGSTDDRT